ncbi:hypothetical protein EVAR_99646_1, partial [Eumeta japonica]
MDNVRRPPTGRTYDLVGIAVHCRWQMAHYRKAWIERGSGRLTGETNRYAILKLCGTQEKDLDGDTFRLMYVVIHKSYVRVRKKGITFLILRATAHCACVKCQTTPTGELEGSTFQGKVETGKLQEDQSSASCPRARSSGEQLSPLGDTVGKVYDNHFDHVSYSNTDTEDEGAPKGGILCNFSARQSSAPMLRRVVRRDRNTYNYACTLSDSVITRC